MTKKPEPFELTANNIEVELNQIAEELFRYFGDSDDCAGVQALAVSRDLLLSGFDVRPATDGSGGAQVTVHQTGALPSVVILYGDELTSLACLIELTATGAIFGGMIDGRDYGRRLCAAAGRRGAVKVTLPYCAPPVTLKKGQALMMVSRLRSVASSIR